MPFDNPVTVLVFDVGFVIVTLPPDIFVHKPVPGDGELPASVTLVVPDDKHWSAPAEDAIGPKIALVVITTLSAEELQLLAIVQVKV